MNLGWFEQFLISLGQECSTASGRGGGLGGRAALDPGGRQGGLLLQHGPVEGVIVLVIEGAEEDPEELPQVHVVGSLLEPEAAAVVEIHGELGREALAEHLDGGGHFLFADLFVLLLFGGGLEALPRQGSAVEVHEDVAQRLHVVAAGLLDAQVSVDAGVPGSSS